MTRLIHASVQGSTHPPLGQMHDAGVERADDESIMEIMRYVDHMMGISYEAMDPWDPFANSES